jgi:hypothetical protein
MNSQDKKQFNSQIKKVTTDVAWLQHTMQGLAKADIRLNSQITKWFILSIVFNLLASGVFACLVYLKLSA